MGFYSFYRIFKDIIRSIFGNKAWRITLIIVIIALAFIFISNNVCNASDLRPWNVYNNTTEYNWSRLTNLNFTSNNLPYKMYEIKPDETYYLYNPNSNSGTIHYFCYTSNDVNRPQVLIEDTSYNAALHLDYNFEMPSGYVDIPYNTLFTPQMTYYVFITDSCELYLFDDKYSNIETYNELSALAVDLKNFLYGTNETTQSSQKVTGLNAGASGKFAINNSYTTLYFTVKQGQHYTVNFNTTSPQVETNLKLGYTDDIPGENVRYSDRSLWSVINYSTSYEFTAYKNSYFYFSYVTSYFSDFSIFGTVNEDINNGLNGQIINQGEETRQTLTDSNISQNSSDYTLPTDNTSDITQDGFASIFDRIRTTFTTGSSTPATITIPFTNKSFVISYDTVFGSANLGIIKTIIQSFWWFIVSLFIVKDIFKKIEKLKTGDIEFTETTNIKEDIL